ncbi:MAG: DOMON-like domain-containing protein [Hydrogenophaga sp.]|uniref:DOMON-like domain-containing protein n=1 Tax=Hydrogenophaga sp. TaxID=1904254 RepID=UPI00261BED60|nr:DOMON-like domain-containing protein [Hydrogenophaga sp.]MCV0437308.1 DOMON-like domain-containing protein [Hydrogenophaga sp.]
MTPSLAPLRAPLRCHPATPGGVALAVSAEVHPRAEGLHLSYMLRGDIAALCIPSPAAPVATDGLWQHTCFEAFVAVDGEAAYQEFNFSPSSAWAAYRFCAERARDAVAEGQRPVRLPAPQVSVTSEALTLTTRVPASALPLSPAVLSIGLSAVIEERSGRLSYWALHHPGTRPDFHHADGRTLRMAAPLI